MKKLIRISVLTVALFCFTFAMPRDLAKNQEVQLQSQELVGAEASVTCVAVIDCSGNMLYELYNYYLD